MDKYWQNRGQDGRSMEQGRGCSVVWRNNRVSTSNEWKRTGDRGRQGAKEWVGHFFCLRRVKVGWEKEEENTSEQTMARHGNKNKM